MSKKNYKVTVVDGKPVVGEGVGFERIRRITGYLVGSKERFNDGKRAEEADRVKHSLDNRISDANSRKQEQTTSDNYSSQSKSAISSEGRAH